MSTSVFMFALFPSTTTSQYGLHRTKRKRGRRYTSVSCVAKSSTNYFPKCCKFVIHVHGGTSTSGHISYAESYMYMHIQCTQSCIILNIILYMNIIKDRYIQHVHVQCRERSPLYKYMNDTSVLRSQCPYKFLHTPH